ncbi:Cyclic-di-GMP-binding biofilm dispersal mediator protein [Achromobacter aegrifaciens]|uniref:SDR family oxidoreductase n=1 Tax=Achromobacter aegrifaciens TaxID=1287736 RepID=UPI0014689C3E|nr:SDR family oxidoreductase [Achromobacter aegrifaciens]CAB3844696.1 Cyclic-di-GMP-binding biofilm dispersal mediator protein [Achromobacter aegrifaciens]
MEFQGKVALVTGGTRGIGAAIVRRFAERGADVAFTYARSDQTAKDYAQELGAIGARVLAIRADSRDPAAVRTAVEQTAGKLGRLDILVNSAGVFPFGPVEDATLEEIDDTLAIHAKAVFVASQAALAHMGTGGRIISIGSCFAQRVPYGGVTLYAMSKSALIGFTKGLAREVGGRGITVNIVDPGSTDTDMNPADGPAVAAELELMAVKRYAEPQEIAAAVAYLAGAESQFITGASLAIDGGFTA